MAAAASIIGPKRVERALACTDALIDLFAFRVEDLARRELSLSKGSRSTPRTRALLATEADQDVRPELMIKAVRARGAPLGLPEATGGLRRAAAPRRGAGCDRDDDRLGPLMRKRISRLTARTLPWYLRLYGVMIGASIPGRAAPAGLALRHPRQERFERWTMADLAFLAMTGKKPTEAERGRCRS